VKVRISIVSPPILAHRHRRPGVAPGRADVSMRERVDQRRDELARNRAVGAERGIQVSPLP
jgi:hypothetical protein